MQVTRILVVARILFFFFLMVFCGVAFAVNHQFKNNQCVQIYYDKMPNLMRTYYFGRSSAILLQNLLGHFPKWQQYVIPISSYKKGQLDRCYASFYLGTYNGNKLPQAFIDDFVSTKRNVVWIDKNIWQLKNSQLINLWDAYYLRLYDLSFQKRDAFSYLRFFQDFHYKGKVFKKFFPLDFPKKYFDLVRMKIMEPYLFYLFKHDVNNKFLVAWAKLPHYDMKIPYILRNKNHWYIAANPFVHRSESGRYIIFSDLLFDVLNEKPQNRGKKKALLRLEDVTFLASSKNIRTITDVLYKLHVPFAVSVVPIYKDPFGRYGNSPVGRVGFITENRKLLEALIYAQNHGASIIVHGVTHQYNNKRNPYSGISADDYEFWDKKKEKPIAEDSSYYVLNRLQKGLSVLYHYNLKPVAWLTPHYHASALDYTIFGQVFRWNVGRVVYVVNKTCQHRLLPQGLTFSKAGIGPLVQKERMRYFADLQVNVPNYHAHGIESSQFFPYTIYGDYYGQRLIPEDLGYVQHFSNSDILKKRTIDVIIRDAKNNVVIRDAWASLFFHPYLLSMRDAQGKLFTQRYIDEIKRIVREFRKAGYEFVDLKTWVKRKHRLMRPKPIEINPIVTNCKA